MSAHPAFSCLRIPSSWIQPVETIPQTVSGSETIAYDTDTEMTAKVRACAAKHTVDELFLLFTTAIPENVIKDSVKSGVMFDYKAKSDQPHSCDDHPLRVHKDLIIKALELSRKGFFLKTIVQAALEKMMKGKRSPDRFDHKIPLRLQAANFCAYFRDLRSVKRSMTTGIRVGPVVR